MCGTGEQIIPLHHYYARVLKAYYAHNKRQLTKACVDTRPDRSDVHEAKRQLLPPFMRGASVTGCMRFLYPLSQLHQGVCHDSVSSGFEDALLAEDVKAAPAWGGDDEG